MYKYSLWEEKQIAEEDIFFIASLDSEQKRFWFFPFFLLHFCRGCVMLPQNTILIVSSNIIYFSKTFLDVRMKVCILDSKLSALCSKTAFFVYRRTRWAKIGLSKKNYASITFGLQAKLFEVLRKKTGMVLRTEFYVYIGSVAGKQTKLNFPNGTNFLPMLEIEHQLFGMLIFLE